MSDKASVHLKLMREMGARSYDPTPPDQNLCFLDAEVRLSDRGHRAHSWLKSKTIHPDERRRRWAWAHDRRGDLALRHLAADLEWDLPAASKIWAELEREGIARRDEKGRLRMCGMVEKPDGRTEDEDQKDEFCTNNLPAQLRLFFQALPENERHNKEFRYFTAVRYAKQLEADGMAAVRAAGQEIVEGVLSEIGYAAEKGRGRPRVDRELLVRVSLASGFEDYFVQTSASTSVQNGSGDPYKNGHGAVQNSASFLPSEQSFRVSKEAAAPPFSPPQTPSEAATPHHSPTPRPPTPTQNQGHEKNLPVEKEARSARALASTIEELTGEQIAPNTPLYRQLGELPGRFGIPVRSAQDFFHTKMKELGKRHYRVTAGGLVEMAETDLPKWIERHTPRSEPSQTSAAVMPAYASVDEEIAELEKFLAAFPHSPSAERDRARLAELRTRRGTSARGAGGAS